MSVHEIRRWNLFDFFSTRSECIKENASFYIFGYTLCLCQNKFREFGVYDSEKTFYKKKIMIFYFREFVSKNLNTNRPRPVFT